MNELRRTCLIAPVVCGMGLACGSSSPQSSAQSSACQTTDEACPGSAGWVQQFPGYLSAVAVDRSDNVYVVGSLTTAFLRKYDARGQEQWTAELGVDDSAHSLAIDSSGNLYVAGRTAGTLPGQASAGGSDAFLRSFDGGGSERWTRQFGADSDDSACCVAVDPDGAVVVAGQVNGSLPGQTNTAGADIFVRKYGADGNESWTRQLGASDINRPSLSVDGNGNVYVVARGYPEGPIRSYDRSGAARAILLLGIEAEASDFDASGNAYVTRSTATVEDTDASVTKYDSDGNESWSRELSSAGLDMASTVRVGGSGHVYVAGDTLGAFAGQTNLGGFDVFVSRVDQNGREVWTQQIGTTESDRVHAITVDGAGNVYLVGGTAGAFPGRTRGDPSDAYVMKMPPW